jgi:hypothetical protein
MSFLHGLPSLCSTHVFNTGKTGHETSRVRRRSRVNFSYANRTRNRGQVYHTVSKYYPNQPIEMLTSTKAGLYHFPVRVRFAVLYGMQSIVVVTNEDWL